MSLDAFGITHSYDDDPVLADVQLSLAAESSVAIMGSSGCGKTTLLSVLGLLLAPRAGTVAFDGRSSSTMDEPERARLRGERIGFVFQTAQLVGSLRAWENVVVPARFRAGKAAGAAARARDLLDGFGLSDYAEHFPHQLSLGQRRRIALARALLLDPALVIADEPTDDLDADNARFVADTLFARTQEGGSLIVATHDRVLAERADAILMLEDGHLDPVSDT